MTTFMKAKFKNSDEKTNIDKYIERLHIKSLRILFYIQTSIINRIFQMDIHTFLDLNLEMLCLFGINGTIITCLQYWIKKFLKVTQLLKK